MKVSRTDSHDWLRVSVTESRVVKISLIASRSGEKVSGIGIDVKQMNAALKSFAAFMDIEDGRNISEKMDEIRRIADASATVADFIGALAVLASGSVPVIPASPIIPAKADPIVKAAPKAANQLRLF